MRPQFASYTCAVNSVSLPPRNFVTGSMNLAVMHAADRNYELVADSASECTRLSEGEVMRIRGDATAHEACLSHHESLVVFVAQANRFAQVLN